MKAMILAAGRGARLAPLTDTIPKPLLTIADKTLIEWQLDKLYAAGFRQFVINLGYRGAQIRAHLENYARPDIHIQYSVEPQAALETGGGLRQALPLLGHEPFAVINADVWCDFDFRRLLALQSAYRSRHWRGHLILAPNPEHHPNGDFGLHNGKVMAQANQLFTFTGISLLDPALFADLEPGRFPLAPILTHAAAQESLSGELHLGQWHDIGTRERLSEINKINLAFEDETKI